MKITGKTVAVLDIQEGTSKNGNAWQKREFVIETAEQYPKKICFTLFGENLVGMCPNVGEVCTVHFNLSANEYKGRWYNSVNAWQVDKEDGSSDESSATKRPAEKKTAPAVAPSVGAAPRAATANTTSGNNNDDDLPF